MTSRTTAIGRILHALHLIDSHSGKTPITLSPLPSPRMCWPLEGVAMLAEVPELMPFAAELAARFPASLEDADAAYLHRLDALKSRAGELFVEYLEDSLRLLQALDIESHDGPLGTYRLVHDESVRKGLAQLSGITQLARDSRVLLQSGVLLQRCFTRQSYGYFVADLQALKDDARALVNEIMSGVRRSTDAAAA